MNASCRCALLAGTALLLAAVAGCSAEPADAGTEPAPTCVIQPAPAAPLAVPGGPRAV